MIIYEKINCKTLLSLSFLQALNEKDVELLLVFLSTSLLQEDLTIPIAVAFEDCLLLLLTNVLSEDNCPPNGNNFREYQRKAIALSKLMHMSTSVKR